MFARAGLILSAAAHFGLLAWVLLGLIGPKALNALPEETMTIDVVTPAELARASAPPEQPPAGSEPPPQAPQPQQSAQDTGTQAPPQFEPPPQMQAGLPIDPTLLSLYNLRLPPQVDSKAETRANLSADSVAAFKSRLKACWRLPTGLSAASRTRVLLRVFLAPDGALATEPMLVEASASTDGPAVLQAAKRALAQCAPYGFLPRERYSEWKVLDVSFSPREMSGG